MKSILALAALTITLSHAAQAQELCGTVGAGDGAVILQVDARPVEILGSFSLLKNLQGLEGQAVCVDGQWKADNSAFLVSSLQ